MSSTSTKPSPKSSASFYQRTLPSSCVAFTSSEGKQIFHSSLKNNGLKSFYTLIQQYHTQTEPAYCGISTLVMVLNALAVDPQQHWKGPWRWYTESMLNCCVDLEQIKTTGITLPQFHCLAICQGVSVDLHYSNAATLQDFRNAIEIACLEENGNNDNNDNDSTLSILVVSYNRQILQQTGSGHFSPIAAYDPTSDMVLILDTARFKYGAHWVPIPLLFQATQSIDPTTKKSRGFALLHFEPSPQQHGDDKPLDKASSTSTWRTIQPYSILFRAKMRDNQERRKYKHFLESILLGERNNDTVDTSPTQLESSSFLDRIRLYWMDNDNDNDGHHPIKVWKIVEPVRPQNDSERLLVSKMRSLLAKLRPILLKKAETQPCCHHDGDNNDHQQKQCISNEEALMIIMMASIPNEAERKKLMSTTSVSTEGEDDQVALVQEELLKEAALIARAIDASDDFVAFEQESEQNTTPTSENTS